MSSLAVHFHDTIEAIPSEAWDALVPADAPPFLEWTWLHALEKNRCVGPHAGWIPRHIAVVRGGDLVAAAPMYIKLHGEGEFVFDFSWANLADHWDIPYYPKLVVAVPFTPVTGPRILIAPGEHTENIIALIKSAIVRFASAVGASSAHVLFPTEQEAHSLTESPAGGLFSERIHFQYHFFNTHYQSTDDFLRRFSSKKRHQLKREMAAPTKDGVTIRTLKPHELSPGIVDNMYAFYTSTVDKFMYGRRYLNRDFFADIAVRFSHRLSWVVAYEGAGDASLVDAAGNETAPIAGAFNLQKAGRLYGRYWGSQRDIPFLHFNVCYYHGIQECIEKGYSVFEPGAGGEHKYARGFEPTLTYSAHWFAHPRLASVIGDFVRREAVAIHEHVDEARRSSPIRPSG